MSVSFIANRHMLRFPCVLNTFLFGLSLTNNDQFSGLGIEQWVRCVYRKNNVWTNWPLAYL